MSGGLLTLVDLAGSENAHDSATHDRALIKETKAINTALMALKDCIRARSDAAASAAIGGAATTHVPYRSSKLTLVLRDAFDINAPRPAKSLVIACVSPVPLDVKHTCNTLKYAELLHVSPPPRDVAKLQRAIDAARATQIAVAAANGTAASHGLPANPVLWTRGEAVAFLRHAAAEAAAATATATASRNCNNATADLARFQPDDMLPPDAPALGGGRRLTGMTHGELRRAAVAAGLPAALCGPVYLALRRRVVDARVAQQ